MTTFRFKNVGLLLLFLLALFAFSCRKKTAVVQPPPPPTPNPPDVSISDLFRRNVQDILFDYDKSDIRPDQVSRLQTNAAFLKEHANVRFTIDGNADERGSQEYNLGLGDRRANAVK